jgi:hypothetical protein
MASATASTTVNTVYDVPLASYTLSNRLTLYVKLSKFPYSPHYVSLKRDNGKYITSIDMSLKVVKALEEHMSVIYDEMDKSLEDLEDNARLALTLSDRISTKVEYFPATRMNYLCFACKPYRVSTGFIF